MIRTVRPATIDEKTIVGALQQPYLHELNQYGTMTLDKSGHYVYRYLDAYWTEQSRYPYLIFHGRKVAGFALVRDVRGTHLMAEFFILYLYRRSGLGMRAASELLARHPGKWHIEFYNTNTGAAAFWREVAVRNAVGVVRERKAGWTRTCLILETKRAEG